MVDVDLEENKMDKAWIFLFLGGRKKTRPSDKWQKEKNIVIFQCNFWPISTQPYTGNPTTKI